jgi:prophage antirepressor-like protein
VEGGPERNIINESGLYSLVLGSRKPEAKSFKKWITSEVVPATLDRQGLERNIMTGELHTHG